MVETGSDPDEDEVEHMIIDEYCSRKPRSGRRRDPTSREKIRKARLDRWAKNKMAREDPVQDTTVPADSSFSMRVDTDDAVPSRSTSYSVKENVKRRGQFVVLNPNRAFLPEFQATYIESLIVTATEYRVMVLRMDISELELPLGRPAKA